MEEAGDGKRGPCKSHPRALDPKGNVKQPDGHLAWDCRYILSAVEEPDMGQTRVSLMQWQLEWKERARFWKGLRRNK